MKSRDHSLWRPSGRWAIADVIHSEVWCVDASGGISIPAPGHERSGVNLHDKDLLLIDATDPEVRGYALQSTLRAMDLGADSKRRFLCCWGGHEGVETDAYRSADEEAVRRLCESITYLCEYGRG